MFKLWPTRSSDEKVVLIKVNVTNLGPEHSWKGCSISPTFSNCISWNQNLKTAYNFSHKFSDKERFIFKTSYTKERSRLNDLFLYSYDQFPLQCLASKFCNRHSVIQNSSHAPPWLSEWYPLPTLSCPMGGFSSRWVLLIFLMLQLSTPIAPVFDGFCFLTCYISFNVFFVVFKRILFVLLALQSLDLLIVTFTGRLSTEFCISLDLSNGTAGVNIYALETLFHRVIYPNWILWR